MDSVSLAITSQSSFLKLGKHVEAGDSGATLEATVPLGHVSFFALVLSKNQTVLYSGTRELNLDGGSLDIDIPLTAASPVLVVSPDTMRIPSANTVTDSFAIHNRGLDSLVWVMTTSALDACRQCFLPLETFGTLGSGRSAFVHLDRIARTSVSGPQIVNITISSSAGSVVTVLKIQ